MLMSGKHTLMLLVYSHRIMGHHSMPTQSLCEINMSKSESKALLPHYVICRFFCNQCGRRRSALRLAGDSILSAESTTLKR